MRGLASPTGADEEVRTTAAPVAGRTARPQEGERITVALIPTAAGHLRRLQERTKMSKTDITNRAITTYEFFEAQLKSGRDLIVRDPRTGETLLVRFL
jgi:hypothetical protein